MKSDNKKDIKELAEKIIYLEQKCQFETDISEYLDELERLSKTLSLEEMLLIDNYIIQNNLLTR